MEDAGSSKFQAGVTAQAARRGLIVPAVVLLSLSPMAVLRTLTVWQDDRPESAEQTGGKTLALGDVHALARLEPSSGLVVVGARPGARIERIMAAQGDSAAAGQVLAILEGHDAARTQVGMAEARKKQVNHERMLKKKKLALEREQFDKTQKAKLDSARRVFATRQQFSLIENLHKQLADNKTRSPSDQFETEIKFFEVETQNLRGELEVKSFEIAQQLVPRQRQLEDEELADTNPDLELLDRQIELARANLAETEIKAPINGQVLEVLAHAGEISSGPVLAMGDLAAMVATAEVDQTDVPRLKLGDAVSVQVLNQAVAGKVMRIGSVVGKNQLTNIDPRALQDRRVVKVTIALDRAEPAHRFVNMEVDVTIKPGGGAVAAASPAVTGK
jgi:HlyD family secretion protein